MLVKEVANVMGAAVNVMVGSNELKVVAVVVVVMEKLE